MTMHLLAEGGLPEFNAPAFSNFLAGLVCLLALVSLGLGVIRQFSSAFGRRPPIDKEIAEIKARLSEAETGINSVRMELSAKITSEFRELDKKRAVSIGQLHSDLEKVGNQVHELTGELKHVVTRVSEISASAEQAVARASAAAATAEQAARAAIK